MLGDYGTSENTLSADDSTDSVVPQPIIETQIAIEALSEGGDVRESQLAVEAFYEMGRVRESQIAVEAFYEMGRIRISQLAVEVLYPIPPNNPRFTVFVS